MIEESLQDYMEKVEIINKDISIYKNEEKGLMYPLGTASLLARVDYLELTKEELEKAKFEQQIDKKEYEMFDCEKVVPKYEITKIEADKFTLTTKKVKATHIYNVKNQLGIHTTLENKEEAFKLCEEINNKVVGVYGIL
jgi:hypothetical protein